MDIYVVQVISFPTFRVYLTSSLVVLCKQWVEKPDGLEFKKTQEAGAAHKSELLQF